MRLLHITRDYAPLSKGGGVERYIHQLALQQVASGHCVGVVAHSADVTQPLPYRVEVVPPTMLLQAIRAAEYMHLHGPRVPYVALAGLLGALSGRAFLYTAHCFYHGHTRVQRTAKWLWDQSIERLLMAKARQVIVLSDYWRTQVRSRGLARSKLAVVANGVDLAALTQETYTPMTLPGNPVMLSVSRLDPVKRLEDTIAVLAEPGFESARLHIVGTGAHEAALRACAAEWGVDARVQFHGFQPDATVAAMARAADVFVLASREEGMPTTVLEMLARGLPVVASDIPGNRALTDALGAPLLYPCGEVAALAEAVQRACATPLDPHLLGRLQQFDWPHLARQMEGLYAPAHVPSGRRLLLGCPLDAQSRHEILARAEAAFAGTGRMVIEGLNVAKLVEARRTPSLMAALHAATVVHTDGAGISLAARLLGLSLPPRRAGIDLMDDLLARAEATQARVFLLGATAEIVAKAAGEIKRRYPQLVMAGTHDGYFAPESAATVATEIAACGAQLLLVGMSSPKKEWFLYHHGAACGAAVAMGVGGSFDVLAGKLHRAPRLMQCCGMEWLFRLMQEPRRLAGRYLRTNSVFALLLLCALLQRSMRAAAPRFSWQEFLPLLDMQTAPCRHELFFLHRLSLSGGRLRALAAMLRDGWMLLRQRRVVLPPRVHTLAVASLTGSSGIEALRGAMAVVQPEHMAVLAHPRVGKTAFRPAPVTAGDCIAAVRQAWGALWQQRAPLSRVIVASCLFRATLWGASWRRMLAAHPQLRTVLLHNDFDMMNSALVSAAPASLRVVCVQHGIPTEEFFPTRAPLQVVWGAASAQAYQARAEHTQVMVDALGRRALPACESATPMAIHLVSQTHTRMYGVELAPYFAALAHAMAAQLPPEQLRILLHPNEASASAYAGIDRRYIDRAPHASLQQVSPRALVVGYASTALLDAAQIGHYVATMDWPVMASHAAHRLCQPPVQFADAAKVLQHFRQLQTQDAYCRAWLEQQQEWLAGMFTDSGELARYVA